MCTVLLRPGGYPIAVKYIISYIISYQINTLILVQKFVYPQLLLNTEFLFYASHKWELG